MKYTALTNSIFLIEDFLTRQECLEYIALSETLGYELAAVNTAAGARVKPHIRNNSRAFYQSEDLATRLWDQVRPFVPAQLGPGHACGLNELFRFYRYQRGHQFRGHFDGSYQRSATEASCFTFMVYLNDNFQGGDTTFRDLRVQPRQGMALVFLHSLYHAGSEVTQGVKYVLRSDIMYRWPAGS
ncbi:prolyl hydroxylase family protein [Hymenobacter chitinivorans]|uniref:Putative 2-oxoglutarate/Fe(II)-dependent dioxygenase YbiX n=1 Tax=Hymenobacter chitinivorans DSM 11115 TaxID=1121954 RepID=A0A2M9BSP3_9BACT|nr:2OG-Fe(II) oxygenase [Hymenobacter chitinivorans]PJJ60979.1 putative 2-oxoglutarate/Fe(II)-dependent dioxygenase YbiX [Hymenobacter chitinivorans DSM 11115]